MREASSSSARTLSRKSSIFLIKSGWLWRKASRLSSEPVSRMVPSVRMIRAETIMRSLLACTPQFMPDALLITIPPTIAEPIEAGSGGNTRPYGFKISLTLAPTIPGWSLIVSWFSPISYFSQCLPATMSTESVQLCPESEVPAARKVKGNLYFWHDFTIFEISSSPSLRMTTFGIWR